MSTAIVIGASGGIGGALVEQIEGDDRYSRVVALSRADGLDITDEASVAEAARACLHRPAGEEVSLVICATGLLHDGEYGPEKSYRALSSDDLARAFAVNAIGPALVAKHFLPLLPRKERGVFAALSARVGSISDNRLGGWYGYRASKAALNQLIRTLAIEHARKAPESVVVALHPGTVGTRLSVPFQSNVPDDKLFSPDYAARQLLSVLDGLDAGKTGRIFAWDGEEIAP
ncbi:MAG: SDR family NAD(P)-dependent oxidoreductase [Pacificimonas sp.]|nr:SDR family NAD(P)-dependent oxidoreductase [Pacificimonas sp.]